jgi:hypothetical protein
MILQKINAVYASYFDEQTAPARKQYKLLACLKECKRRDIDDCHTLNVKTNKPKFTLIEFGFFML